MGSLPSKILSLIRTQYKAFKIPSVTEVSVSQNPYLVLISCILSLRTKDNTTIEASRRLFKAADNPKAMLKIPLARLEKIIPRRLWIELNTLLVAFGQNICLPVSPYCSRCSVFKYCPRSGVLKSR
ncbi:hypothetical protein EPO66_02145 [bacterium]|nr:MAG: hypothetical protein EPO66_02145 [bacterium]